MKCIYIVASIRTMTQTTKPNVLLTRTENAGMTWLATALAYVEYFVSCRLIPAGAQCNRLRLNRRNDID